MRLTVNTNIVNIVKRLNNSEAKLSCENYDNHEA